MKTIRRYGNVAEAGFAQSLLASAGIDAVLADEFAATLGFQYVPQGIRLQVPEEDVERALAILGGQGELEAEAEQGVPAGDDVPLEHEVGSEQPAENEKPGVICLGCGAEWELTPEERAMPSFTCGDCGTVMQQGEAEVRSDYKGKFDWNSFLPRSESKWVFVLVMVAYNMALQWILLDVMSPFVGTSAQTRSWAHGWGSVMASAPSYIIFSPLWQTLALIGIIEMFKAARSPAFVQILVPALLVCSTDGLQWWPHAIYSFPGFVIFALSYLHWRPASWLTGAVVAIAIHATFNAAVELRVFFTALRSEILSTHLTGDASNWERADAIYYRYLKIRSEESSEEQIRCLQSVIAIYPYDPDYFLSLGLAYEGAQRFTDAEAAFRKAVAVNDSEYTWKAWDDLVFVYKDEKRFREAMDAAHHALLAAPVDNRSEIEDQISAIAPSANGTSL